MELFTNILIWIGILTAIVVVALAIHEFIWKPRQERGPGVRRDRESAATEPVVPEEEPPEAPADPVVEVPTDLAEGSGKEAEAEEDQEERFKQLTRSQRLGLARLTTMVADFDRAAGLAVAACKEGDFDAVVQSRLVVLDESKGRYELTEAGRVLGAAHLTPEDDGLVRQFHAEHFTRLVEGVGKADVEDREAAVLGFEMVKAEWPHLERVLDFLVSQEGQERKVLDFAEAVNATGILQSRPEDGMRWYEILLAAARKVSDRERERNVLGHLGSLFAELNNPTKALECYSRSAEICRELEDRHGEGASMGNMGLAWQKLGEAEKAVECFEQTLLIMRETKDVLREGFALASLGQAAQNRGDHAKAIEYHQQHLRLMVESGDARGEMLALAHMGSAHLAAGNESEAIKEFERQLKLARSLDEIPAEGNARGNLGQSFRQLGDFDKAAEQFGRQVEIAHMLNDTDAGLKALNALGQSHQDANRTWKAVECFDDQLKLARQVGDRESEAQALWSAARAVRSLGRGPDAITRISAALAILDSIESPDRVEARADFDRWRSEGT